MALNLASGALLYHTLCRTLMLGSFAALIIVLPFAVPGVGTAGDLTDALGMNIEPLLFTVLFWHLRERPLLLGLTAAVAILNREFTLYALVALACVELMRDRWRVSVWRPHAVTAVAFVLVWSAVALLKQHSSPSGPGTMGATGVAPRGNLSAAASRVCIEPDAMAADVRTVATELLPMQFGLGEEPLLARVGAKTRLSANLEPLWPIVASLVLLGIGRGLSRAWTEGPSQATWFGLYLVLTGTQAIVVYSTLRCGYIGPGNLRYILLALLVPVGAATLALERERRPFVRAAVAAVLIGWAGVCAANHFVFWRGLMASPPPEEYRQLTEHLLARGIRFVVTDYWTGYHVAFLSGERVKPLTGFDRVAEYALEVTANRDRAVEVRRLGDGRCSGGVEIAEWYVCPQTSIPSPP